MAALLLFAGIVQRNSDPLPEIGSCFNQKDKRLGGFDLGEEEPRLPALALPILQQLERTTAARLIPLIGAQQAQRLDCASAESRGRALAARIESWERLVQMLRSDLPPYIARYQALLREAPASERAAVEFLLAHELALQTFAQEEAAGRGAASLIGVRRLLV